MSRQPAHFSGLLPVFAGSFLHIRSGVAGFSLIFSVFWRIGPSSAGKYIKPGLRLDNRLAFCKIFLLRLSRADNTGSRFPSAEFYHKMLRSARAKFHMFLFDGISLP